MSRLDDVEQVLHRITRMAARGLKVPFAAVCTANVEKLWMASKAFGMENNPENLYALQNHQSNNIYDVFCQYQIQHHEIHSQLVVLDIERDPRFQYFPLDIDIEDTLLSDSQSRTRARSGSFASTSSCARATIQFYAGMILRVQGMIIGTFCIMDIVPHQTFTTREQNLFEEFTMMLNELLISNEEYVSHLYQYDQEMLRERETANVVVNILSHLKYPLQKVTKANRQLHDSLIITETSEVDDGGGGSGGEDNRTSRIRAESDMITTLEPHNNNNNVVTSSFLSTATAPIGLVAAGLVSVPPILIAASGGGGVGGGSVCVSRSSMMMTSATVSQAMFTLQHSLSYLQTMIEHVLYLLSLALATNIHTITNPAQSATHLQAMMQHIELTPTSLGSMRGNLASPMHGTNSATATGHETHRAAASATTTTTPRMRILTPRLYARPKRRRSSIVSALSSAASTTRISPQDLIYTIPLDQMKEYLIWCKHDLFLTAFKTLCHIQYKDAFSTQSPSSTANNLIVQGGDEVALTLKRHLSVTVNVSLLWMILFFILSKESPTYEQCSMKVLVTSSTPVSASSPSTATAHTHAHPHTHHHTHRQRSQQNLHKQEQEQTAVTLHYQLYFYDLRANYTSNEGSSTNLQEQKEPKLSSRSTPASPTPSLALFEQFCTLFCIEHSILVNADQNETQWSFSMSSLMHTSNSMNVPVKKSTTQIPPSVILPISTITPQNTTPQEKESSIISSPPPKLQQSSSPQEPQLYPFEQMVIIPLKSFSRDMVTHSPKPNPSSPNILIPMENNNSETILGITNATSSPNLIIGEEQYLAMCLQHQQHTNTSRRGSFHDVQNSFTRIQSYINLPPLHAHHHESMQQGQGNHHSHSHSHKFRNTKSRPLLLEQPVPENILSSCSSQEPYSPDQTSGSLDYQIESSPLPKQANRPVSPLPPRLRYPTLDKEVSSGKELRQTSPLDNRLAMATLSISHDEGSGVVVIDSNSNSDMKNNISTNRNEAGIAATEGDDKKISYGSEYFSGSRKRKIKPSVSSSPPRSSPPRTNPVVVRQLSKRSQGSSHHRSHHHHPHTSSSSNTNIKKPETKGYSLWQIICFQWITSCCTVTTNAIDPMHMLDGNSMSFAVSKRSSVYQQSLYDDEDDENNIDNNHKVHGDGGGKSQGWKGKKHLSSCDEPGQGSGGLDPIASVSDEAIAEVAAALQINNHHNQNNNNNNNSPNKINPSRSNKRLESLKKRGNRGNTDNNDDAEEGAEQDPEDKMIRKANELAIKRKQENNHDKNSGSIDSTVTIVQSHPAVLPGATSHLHLLAHYFHNIRSSINLDSHRILPIKTASESVSSPNSVHIIHHHNINNSTDPHHQQHNSNSLLSSSQHHPSNALLMNESYSHNLLIPNSNNHNNFHTNSSILIPQQQH